MEQKEFLKVFLVLFERTTLGVADGVLVDFSKNDNIVNLLHFITLNQRNFLTNEGITVFFRLLNANSDLCLHYFEKEGLEEFLLCEYGMSHPIFKSKAMFMLSNYVILSEECSERIGSSDLFLKIAQDITTSDCANIQKEAIWVMANMCARLGAHNPVLESMMDRDAMLHLHDAVFRSPKNYEHLLLLLDSIKNLILKTVKGKDVFRRLGGERTLEELQESCCAEVHKVVAEILGLFPHERNSKAN